MKKRSLFQLAGVLLSLAWACAGRADPPVNTYVESYKAQIAGALQESPSQTRFAACVKGGGSDQDCLSSQFLSDDERTGLPLGFYSTLRDSSAYSLFVKNAYQEGLKKNPTNGAEFDAMFRSACASFKKQAEGGAGGLGGGSEKEAFNALCEDVPGSGSHGPTSSTWNRAYWQLGECETIEQSNKLPNHPCAAAFAKKLGGVVDSMSSMLDTNNPVAAVNRTLKKGGYSDGTLDGADGKRDSLVLGCKNEASRSQNLKIEARHATLCIFKSGLFTEPGMPEMQSFVDYFNGTSEANARNSAVQNFLLQLRALAVKLTASTLQKENAYSGSSSRLGVPPACRAARAGDHGLFESLIRGAKAPAGLDLKDGDSKLVTDAALVKKLEDHLVNLAAACKLRTAAEGASGANAASDVNGVTCGPQAWAEARAEKSALELLLSSSPALLYDASSNRSIDVLHEEHSLLVLPAVDDILNQKDPGSQQAKAGFYRAKQVAMLEKHLAELCDPTKIPTTELLGNDKLVEMLLKQPGAQSALLADFVRCVKKGAPTGAIDEAVSILGPLAVCAGASAAATAVATPAMGAITAGACGLGDALRTQIPAFLKSLDATKSKVDGLAAGTTSIRDVNASIDETDSQLAALAVTGAFSLADGAALVKELRAVSSARAAAERAAAHQEAADLARAGQLRDEFGYSTEAFTPTVPQAPLGAADPAALANPLPDTVRQAPRVPPAKQAEEAALVDTAPAAPQARNAPKRKLAKINFSTGIQPCCASVETGLPLPAYYAEPGMTADTDIYFSANGNQPSLPPAKGAYSYERPRALSGRPVAASDFTISSGTLEERAAAAMPPGLSFDEHATLAGKGAQTLGAYFITNEPVPLALRAVGREAERKVWAAEHAVGVLKVRNPNPWNMGISVAKGQIRRDLAMSGLAEELSAKATYKGQRLIRTAKIQSTDAEHALGILRQDPVEGETVFHLQSAINCHEMPATCSPSQLASSQWTLKKAGLEKAGVIDAAAVADAQDRIRALEEFFRDTHADVLNFEIKNGLAGHGRAAPAASFRDRTKTVVPTGFDYNHGSNVIWDAQTKTFIMVDW